MFDSIFGALGRNDAVGLPPVLDLFLVGPRWLAPFYPALVILSMLLVAHLVATKRLPRLTPQHTSKVIGFPVAMAGLGMCIYVVQHHISSANQSYWWQAPWRHLAAALIAVGLVIFIVVRDIRTMRDSTPGAKIYRPEHFWSPVKLVWYVVAPLALYLGITLGVAALSATSVVRWQQYVIFALGVLWLLTLAANTANDVDLNVVYPPSLFGRRFGKRAASAPDAPAYDGLAASHADKPAGLTTRQFPTPTTYRGGLVGDGEPDVRPRPNQGWTDDATFGGGATPVVANPGSGQPSRAPSREQRSAGPKYDNIIGDDVRRTPTPADMPSRRRSNGQGPARGTNGPKYDRIS